MKVYKSALIIALVCLLSAMVLFVMGNTKLASPFLIIFFAALSIGFRGYPVLKGFAFTMIIFAVVVIAMQYPKYFIEVNGFQFSVLITPLIQIIMFGMGTEMGLKDFAGVIKMPKAVLIGLTGHFTVMPIYKLSFNLV